MRDPAALPSGTDADTAVLAQRIERLARSAQAERVPQIAQLLQALQSQLLASDAKPLLRALQDMHHAVVDAQCQRRRPRWLRWLGAAPDVERQYQAHCREALRTRAPVAAHAAGLAQVHQASGRKARELLSRLLEGSDDLDLPVHQAQQLMATLWADLRPERPVPDDPATLEILRALLAGVDDHRELLQRLDGTCAAARDVVRLGRAVLAGRDTLLGLLEHRLDRTWGDWVSRVEPLLHESADLAQVAAGAREATPPRRALLQLLEHARRACTRLQIDEQALAQALTHLEQQLATVQPRDHGEDWPSTLAEPLHDTRA